jgi:hypothetical protein
VRNITLQYPAIPRPVFYLKKYPAYPALFFYKIYPAYPAYKNVKFPIFSICGIETGQFKKSFTARLPCTHGLRLRAQRNAKFLFFAEGRGK